MRLHEVLQGHIGTRVAVTVDRMQSPQALWWATIDDVSSDSVTLTRSGRHVVSGSSGALWEHDDRVHLSLGVVAAVIEGSYFDQAQDSIRATLILQLTLAPFGWGSNSLVDFAPNPSWTMTPVTHVGPASGSTPITLSGTP